jgi:hypothetical protein
MSLFKKAAKTATTKTAKKDDKTLIKVKDVEFFENVKKYQELSDIMKSAKTKSDMIYDYLKDIGKFEWIKQYQKTKKNPGSVILFQDSPDGDETSRLLYVPSDKYISLTPERAEELKEEYSEDIIEENTTFAFDNKMIEKYGDILSRLIEECDEIDEDDKESIIKATTTFTIKKGTIDKLAEYSDDLESITENVKPVMSLKNVEVLKS